ncbi:MAG TPA: hypothetical protein VF258_03655 [Luteolibacter sp.]
MKPIPAAAIICAALALAACDKKAQPVGPAAPDKSSDSIAHPAPIPLPGEIPPTGSVDARSEGAPPTTDAGDPFEIEAARIFNLPDGQERDHALAGFVRNSMQNGGFERTREWIDQLPKGPARDTAYIAFLEDLKNVAPMLALERVEQISDPAKRAALEATIRSSPGFTRPPTEPAATEQSE